MFDSNKLIPNLEKQNLWLGEVNSQLFQGIIKHIKSAFNRFFRGKNVNFKPIFK
jgi:putative transposase